jgi:hypothetical protein
MIVGGIRRFFCDAKELVVMPGAAAPGELRKYCRE